MFYIQSAFNVSDEEKRRQEVNSLKRVNDSFRKIVVIKDNIIPWHDDDGIYYIGIEKFLLGEETGRRECTQVLLRSTRTAPKLP